jgi:Na+/H+ antiporter NhaD/arsenite permease-like protein
MRILGIPFEFVLFALTLAGVAIFHGRNFEIALAGLGAVLAYKLAATDLNLPHHLRHEWRLLLNLFGLLLGFAILARHFEESRAPEWFMRKLPGGIKGGFLLLVGVAVMSTVVDNIAAAILGGVIAKRLYQGKVGVGYLAAIVAASNAGGAGSPIGDTTTTMMWISGVPVWELLRAFIAVAGVVAIVGFFGARAQHRLQPIGDLPSGLGIDFSHLAVVLMIIVGAIGANVLIEFPAAGVWIAILLGALIRPIPWDEISHAWKGALFLLALVLSASLMPVKSLPAASWHTATGLGVVSAVFDNIPLTALAIFQGNYDWGMLAYTVGFGGSMIWFGSSAGVAVCNRFPEAKHTLRWLKEGWHIPLAYVIGVGIFMGVDGWKPYDLASHDSQPIFSPVVGGAIATGVFYFALLVGLGHYVTHSRLFLRPPRALVLFRPIAAARDWLELRTLSR